VKPGVDIPPHCVSAVIREIASGHFNELIAARGQTLFLEEARPLNPLTHYLRAYEEYTVTQHLTLRSQYDDILQNAASELQIALNQDPNGSFAVPEALNDLINNINAALAANGPVVPP